MVKLNDNTEAQAADLRHRFTHHPPSPEKAGRHAVIREELEAAASSITHLTNVGREQSLALTKLEEAMFWANAAIAREADA